MDVDRIQLATKALLQASLRSYVSVSGASCTYLVFRNRPAQ